MRINVEPTVKNTNKLMSGNDPYIWRVKSVNIRRGDIYYADLSPVVGSEQGGVRPVLIVQNDVGNRFSPTVIAGKSKPPHAYYAAFGGYRAGEGFGGPIGASAHH